MFNRSKKEGSRKTQYYAVVIFFCAVCVFAIGFSILNPKPKFTDIKVIDDSAILVHNGQGH